MTEVMNAIIEPQLLNMDDASLDWDDLDGGEAGNPCLVCYGGLNEGNEIKLKCGHSFCYDCLLESYRGEGCNHSSSKNHRICPLCRTTADYLPLRDGMVPLLGIHREYHKFTKKKKTACFVQCKGILKSGPNKGKQCPCQARMGGFCGRHGKKST